MERRRLRPYVQKHGLEPRHRRDGHKRRVLGSPINWLSVCQLDSDGSTTECTVKLSSGKEIIITAKNKLGQCVSLNCYANEIVVYDEVNKERIGTYVKTK